MIRQLRPYTPAKNIHLRRQKHPPRVSNNAIYFVLLRRDTTPTTRRGSFLLFFFHLPLFDALWPHTSRRITYHRLTLKHLPLYLVKNTAVFWAHDASEMPTKKEWAKTELYRTTLPALPCRIRTNKPQHRTTLHSSARRHRGETPQRDAT